MRVLPILFNTDMVRAILRTINPKKATRRVIKEFIPDDAIWGYSALTPKGYISCRGTFAVGYGEKFFKLPCQPEDILYVRETWCVNPNFKEYYYKANRNNGVEAPYGLKWHPSIHMPKEAARIWLRVKDVRVERLCDMKLNDFLNEGVCIRPEAFNDPENAYMQARNEFIKIWDSTIPKGQQDLYSWAVRPWVWVIKFERCKKPEAAGEENYNANDKK